MSGDTVRSFPTTRWSLFESIGSGDPDRRRAVLGTIISRYSPALRGHIVRRRLAEANDVDDLLQGFVTDRLMTSDLFQRADKDRGRFRHLIRRVLTDYAIDQMRRKAAVVRSPQSVTTFDEVSMPAHVSHEAADREFDRDWGKRVVSEAIRMMELECSRVDRNDLWEVFEARLLRSLFDNQSPEPYEHLAQRLGVASSEQASNRLVTCKRMFGRVIRDVVSEYLFSDRSVEDEIADLFSALSQSGNATRPRPA